MQMTRSDSGVQVSLPGLVPFPNFGHGPNHYSVIWSSASPAGMEEEMRKLKLFPFTAVGSSESFWSMKNKISSFRMSVTLLMYNN